ncbi:MAG: NADH peroxidase [Syntrophus sp. PtaU1.Bin208]|nr:MAG: NADH peroxidase [Syntrophus sp. PtaU1.Bin208]
MGKRVVIIGGGAGGPSTAAEAVRQDPSLAVTMIEQGEYVSYAACPMPYYIGDVIKDEEQLIARTPEKFRKAGIDVRLGVQAERVDLEGQIVSLVGGEILPFDVLVLATGTRPILPGIPGEDLEGVFTLKQLPDAVGIKNYLREIKCRTAIIVGAGFIGMEMCEAFREAGVETTVVNRGKMPVPRWDPELGQLIVDALWDRRITMLSDTTIMAIEKGRECRLRMITDQGDREADLILLAIGVRPSAGLAGDMGLALGKTGAISVDFSQRTSHSAVYAVGDCCESYHRVSKKWTHVPLGDIANKQGRVAGRNIAGSPLIFPGIVGAQAFKLFDLEIAATGLDEREALEAGYHPASALVWGDVAPLSGPGETRLGLKLIADESTGLLLGAQAVGPYGAVSRINTLSVALWSGLSIREVAYLDLAYSPPFSRAWDLIHVAAQDLMRKMARKP